MKAASDWLTASGGAFRDWPEERLAHVTPADAVKHPNWAMGPKIMWVSACKGTRSIVLRMPSSTPSQMLAGTAMYRIA